MIDRPGFVQPQVDTLIPQYPRLNTTHNDQNLEFLSMKRDELKRR